MTPKNGIIFFYGKIYTSLNLSIDGLQPTCRYQLGSAEVLTILVKGLHLLNLSKMLGQLGQIIKCVIIVQVHQVF